MPLLEVQNITKSFQGLVAVKDLSFEVEPGQIHAIIGPNGAGKTTAFSVISGFYKPDRGKTIFNGEDITLLRPDQICLRGLTRTFQNVKPFPDITVMDNVIVGALIRSKSVEEAKEKASKVIDFMQMNTISSQLAGSLPIGMRKRLEIAKALATEPKLILLDEAISGLTPSETEELIVLVRSLSKDKGISLVLVEHVMRVIMTLADKIVVLHHGEKISEGTPEQVSNDPSVIEAYLGEVEFHVEN